MSQNGALQQIKEIIERNENYWAELGDEEYLLRFGKYKDDGVGSVPNDFLVLMGDLGVTWEPHRAYPTPRYCRINIEDPQKAASDLITLLNTELPLQCSEDHFQHLVN